MYLLADCWVGVRNRQRMCARNYDNGGGHLSSEKQHGQSVCAFTNAQQEYILIRDYIPIHTMIVLCDIMFPGKIGQLW